MLPLDSGSVTLKAVTYAPLDSGSSSSIVLICIHRPIFDPCLAEVFVSIFVI